MTRVVGGLARGRQLVVPAGSLVRPTSDRVKEALFSALGDRVAGAVVIDLYAGSGGLGVEALSRGAAHVTFIERSPRVVRLLNTNVANVIQHLQPVRVATTSVIVDDVAQRVERPIEGEPFDIAFADPPYELPNARVTAMLDKLAQQLAVGAIVVVERSAHLEAFVWPENFVAARSRRYGDTTVHQAELQLPRSST